MAEDPAQENPKAGYYEELQIVDYDPETGRVKFQLMNIRNESFLNTHDTYTLKLESFKKLCPEVNGLIPVKGTIYGYDYDLLNKSERKRKEKVLRERGLVEDNSELEEIARAAQEMQKEEIISN